MTARPTTLGPFRRALLRSGLGHALLALVGLAGALAVPTSFGQERVSVLGAVVEALTPGDAGADAPAESRYALPLATTAGGTSAAPEREAGPSGPGTGGSARHAAPAYPPAERASDGAGRSGRQVSAGDARAMLGVFRL